MYANISYNKKNSTIQYSHYDNGNSGIEGGTKVIEKEHYVPSFYIVSKKEEDNSLFKNNKGEYLKEIVCDSWSKRKKKIDQCKDMGILTYGSDYSPENLFISDKYNYDISQHIPNINSVFIDIETESEYGFPDVDLCREKIDIITFYNSNEKLFYTLALPFNESDFGKFKNKHDDLIYKEFTNEEDLLKYFCKLVNKLSPDVITGWNSTGFDIPYLFNRIKKIIGDSYLKKLSPFGRAYKTETEKRNAWGKREKTFNYTIKGLVDFDYMLLYKQYEGSVKESYKLDDICELELGEKKKEHPNNCSFREFYRLYWIDYIEYNIQDVRLLNKLEAKKGYLSLSYTLSYKCKCVFPDNMGTVSKQEIAIYNLLKDKGIIADDDWNKKERIETQFDSYDGAFVKDPNPGLYKWVIDIDIASLYPSIIRQLNLSPETKLFQIDCEGLFIDLGEDEEVLVTYPDDNFKERKAGELMQEIRKNKWHLSSNNTVFEYKNNKQGVLPEVLTTWYADRKANKKKSFEHNENALEIAKNGSIIDNDFLKEIT